MTRHVDGLRIRLKESTSARMEERKKIDRALEAIKEGTAALPERLSKEFPRPIENAIRKLVDAKWGAENIEDTLFFGRHSKQDGGEKEHCPEIEDKTCKLMAACEKHKAPAAQVWKEVDHLLAVKRENAARAIVYEIVERAQKKHVSLVQMHLVPEEQAEHLKAVCGDNEKLHQRMKTLLTTSLNTLRNSMPASIVNMDPQNYIKILVESTQAPAKGRSGR